jgi:hypothetical protein
VIAGTGAGAALVLGACGGSSAHHTTAPNSSNPTTTTVGHSSVRPPPAFAARLLADNELTGFVISHVSVYRSADAFVGSEGLGPSAAATETRMLARNGFRVAVTEDLDHQGVAGLSLMQSFTSPAAARAALSFYVAKFRGLGRGSGGFAFFPVAGVPRAIGFRLGPAGGAGSNVAFTDGSYYYLLGEEGSGRGPEGGLATAARRLYRHVHA